MSLRVLHVQDHTLPLMSGYAFRSRYLVATQRTLGVDAAVVSSARHREFDALVEEFDGLRFHRTPWPVGALDAVQLKIPFWRERILTGALARRIEEVARLEGSQILHAHSPMFNGIAALRAGRRLGIPVVYEIRAFWEDDAVDKKKFAEGSFVYRQVRRLETSVCRRADRVVTICDGLKQDVCARGGISEDKVLVVPNGVDAERFEPVTRNAALRKQLGLDGQEVAGFVGSFFHYEGLPLMVESLSLLAARRPNLRLLLVGGGEDEQAVAARVAELGLSDRVVLTGRVPHDEVADYYGLMDVLVYPRLSKRITELVTPLKPLEAQAMAIPVMGSDVGGITELFEDCCSAGQFAAGSPESLADALDVFFSRPAAERELEAQKGRTRVLERRRWTQMVEPELAMYRALRPELAAVSGDAVAAPR